ncbi:lysophospholipid acyltransferase LPCAT4 [Aplochiton taeniatus]
MERRDSHSDRPKYPHPFIFEAKLTKAQKIRSLILGCIFFPVRIFLAGICFLLMWPLARLRMAGLSREARDQPVTGPRQWLVHPIILMLSRTAFFLLGFMWVKVKGRRATLKEAAVLAVAPHSGFLDMLVLCITHLPTVVSRSENTSIPVIGALLEFNQAVIVSRKDPESRRQAVSRIKERLTSNGRWPQMLMFPEGTTTNGTGLIKFKPGAFLAGVPVQPVLLRYPNNPDTVRWTYKGTTWLRTLFNTTAQFYTNVTVEYLPVYTPNHEEKDDPNLYAENVRKLMAKALGIPATDYIMDGRMPVNKLGGLSLPVEPPARDTLSLLRKDGLGTPEIEAVLHNLFKSCQSISAGSRVNMDQLSSILGLEDKKTAANVGSLYCNKEGTVDLRQMYVSVAAVSGLVAFQSLLHTAFTLFDTEGRGSLTAEELSGLMGALVGFPQQDTTELFNELSQDGQAMEEDLLKILTTHPTYQKLLSKYLEPKEAGPTVSLTNCKSGNNNGEMQNSNSEFSANKKAD